MNKSTSTYQPPIIVSTSVPQDQPSNKKLIPIPILFNTLLPNPETDKDKNGKNATMDSCHSSEDNSSDGNLSEVGNASNEKFSNDENEEELMPASEKGQMDFI